MKTPIVLLVLISDSTAADAFYVRSTSTTGSYSVPTTGEILEFDNIVTQIGSGYNASSGMYTAPMAGYYVFAFNVVVKEGTILIKLKDDEDAEIAVQYGKDDSDSLPAITGTVIVQLDQGKRVYLHVQSLTSSGAIWFGNCWFAGWLQKVYRQPSG